jgi:hypothetical protein
MYLSFIKVKILSVIDDIIQYAIITALGIFDRFMANKKIIGATVTTKNGISNISSRLNYHLSKVDKININDMQYFLENVCTINCPDESIIDIMTTEKKLKINILERTVAVNDELPIKPKFGILKDIS